MGHRPILALAKSSEEVCDAFSAASIVITGVVQANFPVGTHVWTSENDYTETQYRGVVTATDTGQVTVSIAAQTTVSAGRIWKPTSSWQPTLQISASPIYSKDLGLETNVSTAGTVYRTQVRDVIERLTLQWTDLPASEINTFWTFLVTTLSNGTTKCTLSWYDYRTSATRTATVALSANEATFMPRTSGDSPLNIEALITTDGTYT